MGSGDEILLHDGDLQTELSQGDNATARSGCQAAGESLFGVLSMTHKIGPSLSTGATRHDVQVHLSDCMCGLIAPPHEVLLAIPLALPTLLLLLFSPVKKKNQIKLKKGRRATLTGIPIAGSSPARHARPCGEGDRWNFVREGQNTTQN